MTQGWSTVRALLLGALFALGTTTSAHAHGGAYSAPAAGPVQGGSAAARGGSASAPPSSTAPTTAAGTLFDSWEFWWQLNRDRFLDLRGRQQTAQLESGGAGFSTGRGRAHRVGTTAAELQRRVHLEVMPGLIDVLDGTRDGEVLGATILAVARGAEGAYRSELLPRAIELLAHPELDVQTSAAIGIGVLGERRASRVLIALMDASSLGRMLAGGQKPADRVRAFAALGLGLLARNDGVDALIATVRGQPDSERELKWAAIAALGLLPAEHARAADACALLLEQLELRSLDESLRAAVALSLGRLRRREALPALVVQVRGPRTKDDTRRSAIIALGLLAGLDDEPALEALHRCLEQESDRPSRHFALVALGEIGARDEQPALHAEQHTRLCRRFREELAGRGRSKTQRPWAAIGASIYARRQPTARAELLDAVREGVNALSDPSARSAFVLATGLLGDTESAVELHEIWRTSRDEGLRGFVALALGLLDDATLVEELRAVLVEQGTSAALRLRVATSLGLLRDRVATDLLVEALGTTRSLDVHAAASRGLALLGDARSLAPLLAIATRGDEAAEVRAFAAVALGLLGERTSLPWNEPLRAHCNYLIGFSAQDEVVGLF